MFYDRFLQVCKENNTKPSPVLKEIGCSSSNLRKWACGGSVNSDILVKISNKFNVSIDYLLVDELTFQKNNKNNDDNVNNDISSEQQNNSPNIKGALSIAYNAIKAYPSNILSLVTGTKIHKKAFEKINNYLDEALSELLDNDSLLISDQDYQFDYPEMSLIFIVLNKLPGSDEFRYLQFLISRRIARNLFMKGITPKTLHEKKMCTTKIEKIFTSILGGSDDKELAGFSLSDITNISETFNVSFDYMFTGKESKNKAQHNGQ